MSTLGFSVSAEATLGLENGRIESLSLIVLILSIQRASTHLLRLVSQGTPIAGRIMDIDHGSRTSVVSRLSGNLNLKVSLHMIFFTVTVLEHTHRFW